MSTELDSTIIAEDGVLDAILEGMVRLLQTHTQLAKAKILHEDDGDIMTQIEVGLAETGLNLIVKVPEGDSDSPDAPIVIIDDLMMVVRIWEDPIVNRGSTGTRIPINKATELVMTHLHHKILGNNALVFKRWRQVGSDDGLVRDVYFQTSTAFNADNS